MIATATILMFPAVVYLLFIGWLAFRLRKGLKAGDPIDCATPLVSVLVAARNESVTIRRLIKSLAAAEYPRDRFRIILSDDHSSDQTAEHAQDEAARQGVHLVVCQPEGLGKRAALDEALRRTTDPWLAFTDADAAVGAGWLREMAAHTARNNVVMVLGRIDMKPTHNWLASVQTAEYQSIAAMTAATALAGMPVMANGASMLVRADVYKKAVAGGFQKGYRSGDDMFLLQYVKQNYGSAAIAFQPSAAGGVSIDPESTLSVFLRQRVRWVSKTGGYTDRAILAVSWLVGLVGLTIIGSVGLALFNPYYWWITVMLYGLKSMADAPLLVIWSRQSQSFRHLAVWFLPLQLIYPFYSVGVVVAGLFIRPVWR